MKILKLENGKYCVRRRFLWSEYLDIKTGDYWWMAQNPEYFDNYCQGNAKEVLEAIEKWRGRYSYFEPNRHIKLKII